MPAQPLSSGKAKPKRIAIPGPPATTTARNIAEYYGAVDTTLGRRMLKRAELEPAQAEAAFRTMELTTLATETFGTLDKAALWLKKPRPLLAGDLGLRADWRDDEALHASARQMRGA